jgi:hypothetical protein
MDKIPIPTDNIFKFYAMFGLLLFIFAFGSIFYTVNHFNELVFQSAIELETIEQIPQPSPVDVIKKQVLKKRLELAASDKRWSLIASYCISGFSVLLMLYGFERWHKQIQPVQDQIAQLQLEKLRHEVSQFKNVPSVINKVDAV